MFNDNYDDELEPDYTAPAPTNRIQTVSQLDNRDLQIGDKLTCLDDSWLHIFTEYRTVGPCITTLFAAEVLPDFHYRIGITDIVQEQGSLKVPAGITAVASLDVIREAIKASEALRAAPMPVKKPSRHHVEELEYDRLIQKLKTTDKIYVGIPEDRDYLNFRACVQSGFNRRGLRVSVHKISERELEISVNTKPHRPRIRRDEPDNIVY